MAITKLLISNDADLSSVGLPVLYLKKLNLMLKHVLEFFHENNIEYWADGGTLLGCVRDNKHIIYDDDEDLGMNEFNFFQFKKYMNILNEKFGYEIRVQPDNVIKIVDNTNCYVRDTNHGSTEPRLACIDIFLYILKDKIYVLSDPKNRRLFKNAEYNKLDLFPLKEYRYGNLEIMAANNPIVYLKNYYDNWEERIVYLYL